MEKEGGSEKYNEIKLDEYCERTGRAEKPNEIEPHEY